MHHIEFDFSAAGKGVLRVTIHNEHPAKAENLQTSAIRHTTLIDAARLNEKLPKKSHGTPKKAKRKKAKKTAAKKATAAPAAKPKPEPDVAVQK